MTRVFQNRTEAGQRLGQALHRYAGRTDTLVLALPRGGVPVGWEVARAIGATLDLMLVRKLGVPGQEELAMGAIASGGVQVLNADLVASLGIDPQVIAASAAREQRELARRELAYRGARPPPAIAGRCVILVDDGLATGATMRAAVAALRQRQPARIVVAVPVAPPDTVARLRAEADEVICLETPAAFFAIGPWYREFPQLTDDEVRELLAAAWRDSDTGDDGRSTS
ncbi:MAG: phosphoribosyltransferase [Porticoccaceae bacterium]|nr:MAG: phosphoribosyltransferase [Porticoccaceae bacterium]